MTEIQKFQPLFCLPILFEDDKVVIQKNNSKITIKDNIELIKKLIPLCDGYTNVINITKNLSDFEPNLIESLIIFLTKKSVIIDSRKQFWNFHNLTKFHDDFGCSLNQEEILNLQSRKVEESFDTEVIQLKATKNI